MGLALGQCRRTIAGLTARDKPVPTPIGLRGLRDQRPSAKLSDSLDPCRGLSTAPVSIQAPPWSSIPESDSIIPHFWIPKGQPTHSPPMRSSSPTPAAQSTCGLRYCPPLSCFGQAARMNFTAREKIWSTFAADETSRKSFTSSLERW